MPAMACGFDSRHRYHPHGCLHPWGSLFYLTCSGQMNCPCAKVLLRKTLGTRHPARFWVPLPLVAPPFGDFTSSGGVNLPCGNTADSHRFLFDLLGASELPLCQGFAAQNACNAPLGAKFFATLILHTLVSHLKDSGHKNRKNRTGKRLPVRFFTSLVEK